MKLQDGRRTLAVAAMHAAAHGRRLLTLRQNTAWSPRSGLQGQHVSLVIDGPRILGRAGARGQHTTSCPRRTSARTAERPMVPVAPSMNTRRGFVERGVTRWSG